MYVCCLFLSILAELRTITRLLMPLDAQLWKSAGCISYWVDFLMKSRKGQMLFCSVHTNNKQDTHLLHRFESETRRNLPECSSIVVVQVFHHNHNWHIFTGCKQAAHLATWCEKFPIKCLLSSQTWHVIFEAPDVQTKQVFGFVECVIQRSVTEVWVLRKNIPQQSRVDS